MSRIKCPKCGLIVNEYDLICSFCGYEFYKANDHIQSFKSDAGKPKLTLVPRQIIKDIAEVREYGNNKYPEGGPDNWKNVSLERYKDALFRHFLAYLDDPKGIDDESGIRHYKHMACNMAFLCEMEKISR